MTRLLNDQEVKRIQLDILQDVAHFCQEHQIRFSLAYGTLLGAVRHKGYIPWDDDIDLLMPRPDYDRFLATYSSDVNTAVDLATINTCIEIFAKVCRNGTRMTDKLLGRTLWGVNIDIFPIDGVPEEGFREYYDKRNKEYSLVSRICPFYKAVSRHKLVWFLKYAVKRVLFPYPGNCRKLKISITDKLREIPFDEAKMAGAFFGDDKEDEFMPRDFFTAYTDLEFEGVPLPCLQQYDAYLKHLFGDYITPPPLEERITRHNYLSFIEE